MKNKRSSLNDIFRNYISYLWYLLTIYNILFLISLYFIVDFFDILLQDNFLEILLTNYLSNPVFTLIFSLYIYLTYQALREGLPEFLVPSYSRKINVSALLVELLDKQVIVFLLMLILVYYFVDHYGSIITLLGFFLYFLFTEMVGRIVKNVLNLHTLIIHNYHYLKQIFTPKYQRKEEYKENSKITNNAIILAVENFFKAFLLVLIAKYIKLYSISMLILFMFLAILFVIYPIKNLFSIFSIREILRISNLKDKNKEDTFSELKDLYLKYVIPSLKIAKISPIIFGLVVLGFIFSTSLPIIVKVILSLIVFWINILLSVSGNILLIFPKYAELIKLVDGTIYRDIYVIEEHTDFFLILNQENKIIRLYKSNIIEVR